MVGGWVGGWVDGWVDSLKARHNELMTEQAQRKLEIQRSEMARVEVALATSVSCHEVDEEVDASSVRTQSRDPARPTNKLNLK